MAHGIVVDHKETGVRYAISERNFNSRVHERVRDLRPGETVLGYTPKRKGDIVGESIPQTPNPKDVAQSAAQLGSSGTTKTEGSSTEGTKDANK